MFGRSRDSSNDTATESGTHPRRTDARGGIAWLPILTGIVVALGAMLLLSGGVGALLVVIDALPPDSGETAELGVAGSTALVVGLFLSYLWGGYTAGRMARGAGVRNGLLVALGALFVALAAAGAAQAADLTTNLNVPFTSDRLPIEEEVIVDWGVLLGLVSLIAMAAGGAYGGYKGARWHHDLEQRSLAASVAEERRDPEPEPEPSETPPPPTPETSAGPETRAPEEERQKDIPPDDEESGTRTYR